MKDFIHKELSQKVIGAFYSVYRTLGYGFLEKVYENAFKHELDSMGISVQSQVSIAVFYKNVKVGQYFADLLVDDKIVIEVKAAESLCEEHEFQLLNYLKATTYELGLLFNFGKEPQFKRLLFTNDRKQIDI